MTKRRCTSCGLLRQDKFYVSSRGRICTTCQRKKRKQTAKNLRLQKTYGISLEQYQALFEAQGGKCAICGGLRSVLDVDHDHKTGQIRGLCCKLHNRHLLPSAGDDPELLERAAEYLRNPPAQSTIGVVIVPITEKEQEFHSPWIGKYG